MQHVSFANAAIEAFSYLVQEDNFLPIVADDSYLVRFRSRGYEPAGEGDSRFDRIRSSRDAGVVHVYAVPGGPSSDRSSGMGEFIQKNTGWEVFLDREHGSDLIDLRLKKGLFQAVYMHEMRTVFTTGELQEVSRCHFRDGENLESHDLLWLAELFRDKWRLLRTMSDDEFAARVAFPSD
jgi:hypothetical protein